MNPRALDYRPLRLFIFKFTLRTLGQCTTLPTGSFITQILFGQFLELFCPILFSCPLSGFLSSLIFCTSFNSPLTGTQSTFFSFSISFWFCFSSSFHFLLSPSLCLFLSISHHLCSVIFCLFFRKLKSGVAFLVISSLFFASISSSSVSGVDVIFSLSVAYLSKIFLYSGSVSLLLVFFAAF